MCRPVRPRSTRDAALHNTVLVPRRDKCIVRQYYISLAIAVMPDLVQLTATRRRQRNMVMNQNRCCRTLPCRNLSPPGLFIRRRVRPEPCEVTARQQLVPVRWSNSCTFVRGGRREGGGGPVEIGKGGGGGLNVGVPFRFQSSGAVWKSRWPFWAPGPNEPYGFCGRKATLNHA